MDNTNEDNYFGNMYDDEYDDGYQDPIPSNDNPTNAGANFLEDTQPAFDYSKLDIPKPHKNSYKGNNGFIPKYTTNFGVQTKNYGSNYYKPYKNVYTKNTNRLFFG